MNWKFSTKGHYNIERDGFEKGMGYVYIAKIHVMNQFYLTKIGATTAPKERMMNFRNLRICAISKPHYNFFENEGLLHDFYEKYRIPPSPKSRNSQPELFNISVKEIILTMPELYFETDLNQCYPQSYAKEGNIYYTKRVVTALESKKPL